MNKKEPIVKSPMYPVRGEWLKGDLIKCGHGYEIRVEKLQKIELREPLWLDVEQLESAKAEIEAIISVIERLDGEQE